MGPVARSLRFSHRYRVRLDADAFERVLRERADIALLHGEPTRVEVRSDVDFVAWRATPERFVIVRPGRADAMDELAPPPLHIRFRPSADGSVMVLQARLTLGTPADALAQHGRRIVTTLGTWAHRGVAMLGALFIAGMMLVAGALMVAGVAGEVVGIVVGVAAAAFGLARAYRELSEHAEADPAPLTFSLERERLLQLAGDLVTPFKALGEASVYRR
jgi:hypothetical protein